ncbi:MAG TPA: hypothetical protein VE397_20560 [Stellaceae bacterium]|jgi:hypothetical protein|nr:hypothetical protein [Stellaceae bacterium]
MDLASFHRSLAEPAPPAGLGLALEALWWDAKGDWQKAHECAQARDDGQGAWVHAYLHRREGDAGNAAYWYRRAGKPVPSAALDEERAAIIEALLSAPASTRR